MSYEFKDIPKIHSNIIEEFLDGSIGIECSNRKDALYLLYALKEQGIVWSDGDEIDKDDGSSFFIHHKVVYYYSNFENGICADTPEYMRMYITDIRVITYQEFLERNKFESL